MTRLASALWIPSFRSLLLRLVVVVLCVSTMGWLERERERTMSPSSFWARQLDHSVDTIMLHRRCARY
jgi:hypothetical protein